MKMLLFYLLVASSALANYRYEWAYQGVIRPQGSFNSGFIEFFGETGTNHPIETAIADFAFTSQDSPSTDINGNPLPVIPAQTFTLSDGIIGGLISWNGQFVGGLWSMYFADPVNPAINTRLDPFVVMQFWPLEYFYNESSQVGRWVRVPDGGSTLLMLDGAILLILAKRPRKFAASRTTVCSRAPLF